MIKKFLETRNILRLADFCSFEFILEKINPLTFKEDISKAIHIL